MRAGAAVLVAVAPGGAAALELDWGAVAAGQWWRLLTGHWTHFSWDHLLLDSVVFGAVGAACSSRDRWATLATVLLGALGVSLAVWCFAPGISTYRGLSGLASALTALLAIQVGGRAGALALVGIAAKVAYELLLGEPLFITPVEGVSVVPVAHVAGAVVGAGIGVVRTHREVAPAAP
jgi:rhomboid family GlyGly-CTERM serine protease